MSSMRKEWLLLMVEENIEWATPQMKEYTFWHDGMTPEDYEIEQAYYLASVGNPEKRAKYKPLWKQLELDNTKKIKIDASWASPYMKGFSFWHEDITIEEYKSEYRKYFETIC